ncbi:V0D/AC39 family V-type ATPase subunit [Thiobacillus sedimenti]|uniref:V-type ATPase subunit n=1 Tax=Thiobacillus sedimenti TaxID=3110231 RepID=A0ABZ1CMF2_9PROT|nr:V-type ATPase subunit [Thiobacillus sp. SCUT-2]WRS40577.1 V-type ATPase subunit [Thiobacillus sp. SCUT-2]
MSAYLDTRVSLYSGRLWRDAELDALVSVPDGAMAATLVAHGLPQLVAGYDRPEGAQHDPRSLEQRIIARILDETQVLIRPLAGEARAFLAFWTARFEISNVKTLLRSKMSGERPAAALARLTPMGPFARLDNQALAHAEDVGELLRRLEAGPYADIVRHARRAFEQSHDPFSLDAALDRSYYEGLVLRAHPLETELGAPFRSLMSSLIDRINLVWLLRYRFNYKLPPAQVYYLLVGSRYGLGGARLRELAALDSTQAVLAALPAPWQAQLAGVADIPGAFARMEDLAAAQARRVLRSNAPGVARSFAYLILRERDLRAVRAVLRGRHLGLAEADIRTALRRAANEDF